MLQCNIAPVSTMYRLYELQRTFLEPLSHWADASARTLTSPDNPFAWHPGVRLLAASQSLFHRMAKRYEKPEFGIEEVVVDGLTVSITEEVEIAEPFCQLVRFRRVTRDAALQQRLNAAPRVLLCAPLSGHHSTLLRDTLRSLLHDHEVFVTDWVDAREVPLDKGVFHLDDFVHTIMRFIRHLDAEKLHVVSVCQPTVPVLAAVSLLAQAKEPTPRTLTLMGGPINAQISPTEVNALATKRSIEWFEKKMIHVTPHGYPGAGRRVYPGFLQLTAFVAMNPKHHMTAYLRYWFDVVRGDAGEATRAVHEQFYDEYNAVLDMDAPYYLETVRTVFQEFRLANGTWDVRGVRVDPSKIVDTAVFTIEGEEDDISGLGQTEFAHTLCKNLPFELRKHHVAPECGHYGIFSGRRWRDSIYPLVRGFIARFEPKAQIVETQGLSLGGDHAGR
jgi:poly(3-hydroxybutyrate) depolymerase